MMQMLKKWSIGHRQAWQSTAAGIKCLITLWALSGDSLSLMLSGYAMDVPIVKYVFTILESLDGWGIERIFMALGLMCVFYLVRDRQKSPWVSGISLFFAICTVFGISYSKTNSWDCIFLFHTQTLLAVFVLAGYYFVYKNSILFVSFVLERRPDWLRRETRGKAEDILFRQHPFMGPFLLMMALGLPWLIFYFPGTLQWDAHAQLWMYLGAVEKTGHHPVMVTEWMGGCIWLGRNLFHSDTIGLFLYTGIQFTAQCLTFAYASYILRRLKTPVLFSWGGLLFWSVYPYFPIWGYTMVKDTFYYIFVLLLVAAMLDLTVNEEKSDRLRQTVLLLSGAAGTTLFRNDGRYVVIVTMICGILLYRKHWKRYLMGLGLCILLIIGVDGIYMPWRHIPKGPQGEMLSIPLQQTARYLREHYDELTDEEMQILQEGFVIELKQVADSYNPICSDPVKANFQAHPDKEYMKSYFRVWGQQLVKHPATYVQAFLNQIYGYFYPDMHNYGDYIAFFYIGNSEKWHDGYLDVEFGVQNDNVREILKHSLYVAEKMPVLSMLLSTGMHTFLMIGELVYLLAVKRRREILMLIPGMCVLAVCMASPVNAYLRYMMPVMAILPVTAAWCFAVTHNKSLARERVE